MAAVATSSTDRLCPRCTTSAPCDCRIRRMMLMEASCPSNRLDAVTNRTGFTGRCRSVFIPPKYLDFLLLETRVLVHRESAGSHRPLDNEVIGTIFNPSVNQPEG